MKNKKKYGQFYTTNCNYILSNITIPNGSTLIEPFVGQGDLVLWSKQKNWETYDVDPKITTATIRDTLLKPPDYKGKFVITNPPFLARNKNKDKTIYDLYDVNDLYKAAIKSFIEGEVEGGILIIPLNFFCDRDKKIRDLFFAKYNIDKVNIFEETVFDDTSCIVCSFLFDKKKFDGKIEFTFYPDKAKKNFLLEKKYGWKVAGSIFEKKKTKYKLGRLVKNYMPVGFKKTSIYLQAIDTGTNKGKIKLIPKHKLFYDETKNRSNRAFATIISNIKIKDEELVCEKFNERLEKLRKKYKSLFLVNYRNSTANYSRKRISFSQCYTILIQILEKYN